MALILKMIIEILFLSITYSLLSITCAGFCFVWQEFGTFFGIDFRKKECSEIPIF